MMDVGERGEGGREGGSGGWRCGGRCEEGCEGWDRSPEFQ